MRTAFKLYSLAALFAVAMSVQAANPVFNQTPINLNNSGDTGTAKVYFKGRVIGQACTMLLDHENQIVDMGKEQHNVVMAGKATIHPFHIKFGTCTKADVKEVKVSGQRAANNTHLLNEASSNKAANTAVKITFNSDDVIIFPAGKAVWTNSRDADDIFEGSSNEKYLPFTAQIVHDGVGSTVGLGSVESNMTVTVVYN